MGVVGLVWLPAAVAKGRAWALLQVVHWGCILVVLLSPPGAIQFSALVLILLSWSGNRWARFRRNPLSLVFAGVTTIFFVVPGGFMSAAGQTYQFGEGVTLAAQNAAYHQAAAPAILLLALLHGCSVVALALSAPRVTPASGSPAERVDPRYAVGLLAIPVIWYTAAGIEAIFQAYRTGDTAGESLGAFLFFDHAYLMLLPLVAWRRWDGTNPSRSRSSGALFALLVLFFLLQATVSGGSKGFILTVGILCFLTPISLVAARSEERCLFPTRTALVFGASVGVIFFVLGELLRTFFILGGDRQLLGAVQIAVGEVDANVLSVGLRTAAYRMSASLDRYVLICHAVFTGTVGASYAATFGEYVLSSFGNLVLPGTPYPQAFVPSSNLLPDVLAGRELIGEGTKASLIQAFNTQPFSLYGVALISVRWFAPVAVAVLWVALSLVYRATKSVAVRLGIAYAVFVLLNSYGFEVALANTIHLVVSIAVFLALLRAERKVRWVGGRARARTPVRLREA